MSQKQGLSRSISVGGVTLAMAAVAAVLIAAGSQPLDATIDLRWARWVTFGAALAAFAAVWSLRDVDDAKRSRGAILLCGLGALMLGSLIPGLGRRAVAVDDAVGLGAVLLVFGVIAVENFIDAMKKGASK